MRRRRKRSRARASTAVQPDAHGQSNVDRADCGDDGEDGDEGIPPDQEEGENEEAERCTDAGVAACRASEVPSCLAGATTSAVANAVVTAVAAVLDKTLGYSGGEYEVEQYEGDGVSTFEVLVFAPNGHRLTPEQYVAAEQAVTDVLTGAHVDVDRVAVFGITR